MRLSAILILYPCSQKSNKKMLNFSLFFLRGKKRGVSVLAKVLITMRVQLLCGLRRILHFLPGIGAAGVNSAFLGCAKPGILLSGGGGLRSVMGKKRVM